ncbi:FliH/SctL family protein [Actinoplanes friuliensis]|jgi:flagellar assembly protein FliH|uniref:Putative flagellar assembly protein n=1 Tax=Actinoplanes friuliensis DSM 7358 TaxID=1246995 RepID=U5WAU2_9ACTN|nr:FliH/SctL family protein [Actinoplanes friuliensis]AGZ46343.1 putative flagellar assembly protein [Actinoplanes friuliensis DSM 7358]
MSSSPDDAPILRGTVAESATAARFGVDLRRGVPEDSAPVERAKQQARTAGYAEGWAQGQRAAALEAEAAAERARAVEQAHDQRRAAALAQAINALGRAVTGLETQMMPTLHELQEAVLAHAFELAEAIVGRSLDDPEGRAVSALRRAMNAAPDQGEIVVSLHPDDFRNLVGTATDADYNYEGRPVHLRPEPALRPGDAVAETGTTTVDASIATAVARAKEALRL